MPRGDGTGPMGQGPGKGRGMGLRCRKGGRGRGGFGAGRVGECICPRCGQTVQHQQGLPCKLVQCPSCGTPMMRKG